MPPLSDVLDTTLTSFSHPLIYLVLGVVVLMLTIAYLARPRRVYFVRHGQTAFNTERIRQGALGPLSEDGRKQAQAAAEYLAQFPIRAMVASTYERSVETAHIIQKILKIPLSFSPLLIERRNPSEIVGKKDDDPAVMKVVDQIDRIYHEDDFRYSDEENFVELRDRARKCLDLLASQSAGHLLVVTHGIFLKMIIGYLLNRERLHAGDYAKLSFFNASDNAGITICEYNPAKRFSKTRGWRVIEYNITPYQSEVTTTTLRGVPRIPAPIS
ncbi:MAG TPA: histidine phosphatase family protein [Candidatus Paceibacterota bacterium]